eukprot:scaffold1148_cov108-Isochrysis_galbana.AAC.11
MSCAAWRTDAGVPVTSSAGSKEPCRQAPGSSSRTMDRSTVSSMARQPYPACCSAGRAWAAPRGKTIRGTSGWRASSSDAMAAMCGSAWASKPAGEILSPIASNTYVRKVGRVRDEVGGRRFEHLRMEARTAEGMGRRMGERGACVRSEVGG